MTFVHFKHIGVGRKIWTSNIVDQGQLSIAKIADPGPPRGPHDSFFFRKKAQNV